MLNVCLNMVGKRKNLDACPHRTSGHLGNLTALVSVESWRGSLVSVVVSPPPICLANKDWTRGRDRSPHQNNQKYSPINKLLLIPRWGWGQSSENGGHNHTAMVSIWAQYIHQYIDMYLPRWFCLHLTLVAAFLYHMQNWRNEEAFDDDATFAMASHITKSYKYL